MMLVKGRLGLHLERVNAMLGEVKLMYRGLSAACKQFCSCCVQ